MVNQRFDVWQNRTESGEFSFKLKISSQVFNDTVAEGSIVEQTPASGETMRPDGTINVVVSKGSATRTLPDFQGASFAELQAKLTENGFEPKKEEQFSSEVELGYVIGYKDYKAGDTLDYATMVVVLVSAGPEEN